MHYVMFMLVCLFWGSSFILMKRAHDVFGPLTIATGRVIGGAAVVYLLWAVFRKGVAARNSERWPIKLGDVLPLMLPAIIGMAWPFVMQPYLIGTYQQSAFFGMMVSLVPIFTIAVSVVMLGIYPTRRELVGVVGGLGMMGVLFYDALGRGVEWQAFGLALTVPLCYAVSNTFIKRRLANIPALVLTCWTLTVVGLVLGPLSMATEQVASTTMEGLVIAIGAVLFLGVVCTGVSTTMFYRLVQVRGPLFAGMVAYVIAPSAVVWGWLDGEPITWVELGALAGILVMVGIVQWPSPVSS